MGCRIDRPDDAHGTDGSRVSAGGVGHRVHGEASGPLLGTEWADIFDSLTDAVTIHDEYFNIVDANSSARRLLGLPDSGRLFQPKCFACYHGTSQPPADCPSCTCITSLKETVSEVYEPHLTRHLELRAIPRIDAHGRCVGVVHVVRDVTERKRTTDALRESESRHRTIIQTAMDGFWAVDMEGRLLEVNESYCRMSGYSAQELRGMRVAELDAIETEADVASRISTIIEHGESRFESRHRRKDGTVFDVEVSVRFLTEGGVRMIAFLRDITARKQAEEKRASLEAELRQSQKMESVGRLAGGVAHDFNNMLGVILGHADLALAQVDPALPLYADLVSISNAARRSADLTGQLLAFARKQTVVPRVLDLNDAVAGMLAMLNRLIGEDISLRWLPAHGLWPVRIDPSQFDQILANLCVNARDAIAGVGSVTISTANRTVDDVESAGDIGMTPGEFVLLVVSDDGSGMDRETLSHIFEPFFTTKGVGKGTGLGLASVYGAVTQNGGSIGVRSEPGAGTTFTISLPRHAGRVEDARADGAHEPVRRGDETILLVEDEALILALTKTVLGGLGYAVLAAGSPAEALRLAGEHAGRIDLLMTDVVMPEMNGRELAARVAIIRPDIKILLMSGYTADAVARHGVLEDGVQFLQKPFAIMDVAAKIRETLDRE